MNDQAGPGNGGGDDAAEALSIVKELRVLIVEILDRLTNAVKYGRRTRVMSWLLVVSVALDIGLTGVTVHLLGEQSRQQQAIHAAQLHACAIGNSFRAGQVHLWNHIIAVSAAPPHETPAERKARLARLAAFRAYIARQFRPVDCARLYRN